MPQRENQTDLQVIIHDLLSGDSGTYRAIKSRISQYICHQRYFTGADREDLVSDIMTILVDCLRHDRFRGNSIQALNVFIYKTIRNRLNHLERRSEPHVSDASLIVEQPTNERLHGDAIADQQLAMRIYASLDIPCRQLLWMRFHLHWTDQEIAEYSNKTKNAVSTGICRCLQKARALGFLKDLS